MNHYLHTAKTYLSTYKKELLIGLGAIIAISGLTALFVYNNPQVVVYQPADACKLFTPSEAQELLGDGVISLNTNKPVLSGDVATSKCSYTDRNPDQNQMRVAAVAVRAGVNDKGIKQNTDQFAINAKPSQGAEAVKDLGDSAFYNQSSGQLNILDGRNWIIVSYGVGAMPSANSLDDLIKLAHEVVPKN